MAATHESRNFFLDGPAGRLEAILWRPANSKRSPLAALVSHPHPLFGGTMHNKVVYQAAKSLDEFGLPVLRFSFGSWVGLGVGCEDVRVAELIGIGVPVNESDFAYLSGCSKPKLFVQGSKDKFGSLERLEMLVVSLPGENRLTAVKDADHFFTGKLDQLGRAITNWLKER